MDKEFSDVTPPHLYKAMTSSSIYSSAQSGCVLLPLAALLKYSSSMLYIPRQTVTICWTIKLTQSLIQQLGLLFAFVLAAYSATVTVTEDGCLTGVQALDDGGGVDEVSTAEGTQQVLVDVVDATSSSTAHLLARHATRCAGRLAADVSGRLHYTLATPC